LIDRLSSGKKTISEGSISKGAEAPELDKICSSEELFTVKNKKPCQSDLNVRKNLEEFFGYKQDNF